MIKMKFLSILLIPLLLSSVNCTSQQKKPDVEKTETAQKKSTVKKVEIRERTRGTNRIITFIPGSKITSLNGNVTTSVLAASDWKKIVKQAGMIDLSAIASLQAPTNGSATDRALASVITVTTDDGVYKSSSFDSGIPPKELENLYWSLVDRKRSGRNN